MIELYKELTVASHIFAFLSFGYAETWLVFCGRLSVIACDKSHWG